MPSVLTHSSTERVDTPLCVGFLNQLGQGVSAVRRRSRNGRSQLLTQSFGNFRSTLMARVSLARSR